MNSHWKIKATITPPRIFFAQLLTPNVVSIAMNVMISAKKYPTAQKQNTNKEPPATTKKMRRVSLSKKPYPSFKSPAFPTSARIARKSPPATIDMANIIGKVLGPTTSRVVSIVKAWIIKNTPTNMTIALTPYSTLTLYF